MIKVSLKAFVLMVLSTVCLAQPSPAATVTFPAAGMARIEAEIADEPGEIARGLMFRRGLDEGKGMWFVFPDDAPRTFWMKNVAFPIDIIYIDRDFFIKKIWKAVPPCLAPPCARYRSGSPIRYTLETPAGFCDKNGVRENQKVIFEQ